MCSVPSRDGRSPIRKPGKNFSENTRYMLLTQDRRFSMDVLPADEIGDETVLFCSAPSFKYLNLTAMTEEEVLAFKQMVVDTCDFVLPIVRERDRIAREAAKAGDMTYKRLWRSDPKRANFDPQPEPRRNRDVEHDDDPGFPGFTGDDGLEP